MRLIAVAWIIFAILNAPAHAEEWGLLLGVHHTCATSREPGTSISGDFGIRTGIQTSFFLSQKLKIRTGAIYTQRHFEVHAVDGSRSHSWDYLDLPILLQYDPKPGTGLFIGPTVAANQSALIFLQGGVNFIFDNMYGFDIFYETNPGPVDVDAEKLSAIGINLMYYFL